MSPHPPHLSRPRIHRIHRVPASAASIPSRVRRIHRVYHVHHLSFDPRQGLLPSVAPFPPTHGATSRYFVDPSVTTGGRRDDAARKSSVGCSNTTERPMRWSVRKDMYLWAVLSAIT